MRVRLAGLFLSMVFFSTHSIFAQLESWQGEWATDLGYLDLKIENEKVEGKYKSQGRFTGSLKDASLVGDTKNGNTKGTFKLTLADDGSSFEGTWQRPGYSTKWRGWKKSPKQDNPEPSDFSGTWLTTWGTLILEQDGADVNGTYGPEGWSTVKGKVTGRRLDLKWKRIRWSGDAWLEQTKDGKRIFGATENDSRETWLGIKLDGYQLHADAKSGKTVQGRTKNGILYHLRMPDEWKPAEPVDLVVLLHGSNWTTRGMVPVTAKRWPSIGKKFAILGIQGHQWAKWSDNDDLRFNYAYVNWMGRSTYRGYPFTDRESPFLVMKAIEELDEVYHFDRTFVGGHSQGAYLTYLLHMHFPEKLAGTFPMAGGLVMQAEPDVFEDESLIRNQRATPMTIIHGTNDNVVAVSSSQYAFRRFLAYDFPNVRFISPGSGHPYDFLPVGKAVRWLDRMTSPDPEVLQSFGAKLVDQKKWRDVSTLLAHADRTESDADLAKVRDAFEAAASAKAESHLAAINANQDGSWVDDFLSWQEDYGQSNAAQPLVAAFQKLQTEHNEPAKKLRSEARKLFRSGDRSAGYEKYEELVDKHYASRLYRQIRETLKQRQQQ